MISFQAAHYHTEFQLFSSYDERVLTLALRKYYSFSYICAQTRGCIGYKKTERENCGVAHFVVHVSQGMRSKGHGYTNKLVKKVF